MRSYRLNARDIFCNAFDLLLRKRHCGRVKAILILILALTILCGLIIAKSRAGDRSLLADKYDAFRFDIFNLGLNVGAKPVTKAVGQRQGERADKDRTDRKERAKLIAQKAAVRHPDNIPKSHPISLHASRSDSMRPSFIFTTRPHRRARSGSCVTITSVIPRASFS